MADQTKLEEMLERLINGDKAGAEELFHEYTIEKSRSIYETLLEDDEDLDEVDDGTRGNAKPGKNADGEDEGEVGDATGGKGTGAKGKKMPPAMAKKGAKVKEDEEVDESDDDDLEEDFDLDEFEVEADPMDAMMGGDETDDMMGDIEGDDDMDMDDEGDDDMEDRVEDLEDALDELKAEFEKMMAGEEGDEDDMDMDMDMDDEEGDDDEAEEESYAFESDDEDDDEEVDESDKSEKSAGEQMREYVEKVTATMGDNGANTKSTVAGKNDMGGTAANIAKGGTEAGVEANKGNLKGSALSDQNAKEDNAGNVNVPGGKASKSLKSASKPKMGDTGTNGTKSTIGQ